MKACLDTFRFLSAEVSWNCQELHYLTSRIWKAFAIDRGRFRRELKESTNVYISSTKNSKKIRTRRN